MASHGKNSNRTAHENRGEGRDDNPKLDPGAADNRIKDPEDWVTGHEPMTGAQASYLKTLSEQAHEPEAFDPKLDKAEASKRIDGLKQGKAH
jgi:hypothetical protein